MSEVDSTDDERSPMWKRFDTAVEEAQKRITELIENDLSAPASLDEAREAFAKIVNYIRAVALLDEDDDSDWVSPWPAAERCDEENEGETSLFEDFEKKVVPFLVLQLPDEATEALYEYLRGLEVLDSEEDDEDDE